MQQECSFRISETDRQEGFDGAITLLLDKFPKRSSTTTMDYLWNEGGKYLQQIAAVTNDWHDSQNRSEPLLPSTTFCKLMADAAWYVRSRCVICVDTIKVIESRFVRDNDTAGVMSLVIDCAAEACTKFPADKLDKLLRYNIIALLSIRNLFVGDLKSSNDLGH